MLACKAPEDFDIRSPKPNIGAFIINMVVLIAIVWFIV